MRGSVRHFALLLLAATYSVLWTCGSAWHLASCADSCCVAVNRDAEQHASEQKRSGSCASRQLADGKHAKCRHSHGDVPVSDKRLPDSHDQSRCEICQLFAQSLTFVSVVSVEVSPGWVESSVCLIPLAIPECELLPAASRGPPAMA